VLSLLDHVRRHYDPHDAVVVRDPNGHLIETPARPGTFTEPGLVVYRFGVGIFYANAARLTQEVMALVDVESPPRWLVLQADAIDDVDFTGGQTLVELAGQLHDRNVVLVIAEVEPSVLSELTEFGLVAAIGAEHVYDTLDAALAAFSSS